MNQASRSSLRGILSVRLALPPTWRSLSCSDTRFKLATENGVVLHIRVKCHERTAFHPLVQKRLGCASENRSAENSITDAACLDSVPFTGTYLSHAFLYPPFEATSQELYYLHYYIAIPYSLSSTPNSHLHLTLLIALFNTS